MSSKFRLEKQKAKVDHVNNRMEAAGEDQGDAAANDIKLEFEDLPAELVKPLLPVDSDRADFSIVEALYTKEGAPRFNGLGTIKLTAEYEDVGVTVGGLRFEHAKLKSFKITKVSDNKRLTLVCTAQVHPSETQIGALVLKMKREANITIEPQPELDLEHAA